MLLRRLVNYWYGKGAVCVSYHRSVKDWSELFAGEKVSTTALFGRLLHPCRVLNISGRSDRLKDLEKSVKNLN